ncbi:MAG: Holliday junction branch migration protein RuvA [Clostridia bacterium]|nr:Holliday junction branch migration protein RuvA [Clostridia bacterium]MBR3863128.1 Holliday junction branch migration protein RuvA [Clostridia bacterium]
MFHYISGPLAALMPSIAVVDAGGVGFKLTVSSNTYEKISPAAAKGECVKLYTHLAVREDDMELFGFYDESELETFRLLITVSGVGPKAAMAILSAFTPEKFAFAVCTEDKKTIARANGIGPKTAARIILELHDKMAAGTPLPSAFEGAVAAMPAPEVSGTNNKVAEAQEALLVLGYSRTEVLSALSGIDTAVLDVENIIRAALKKLM